mgnify:CR=1 FL=1
MQPDQTKRIKQFSKWWKNNKTNRKASRWLTKHAQRCVHDYCMPPDVFDKTKAITKRYNLSEYKRLTRSEAWFLWRITYPLHTERVQRILATGAFLDEKRQQISQ